MPYYIAVLHPQDWTSATIIVPIPETVNKVTLGGGNLGSAATSILGAGQPFIYGTAASDCFFTGPGTAATLPATGDPPFPPVWPYLFSTGDIYGRQNLNQNLKMVRGDDFSFDIGVTLNGAVVDLTNCSLRMTAKWNVTDADADAVFTLTTGNGSILITNPAGGRATFNVSAAKTASLPAHTVSLPFDIQLYNLLGQTKTLLLGTLVVVSDISVVAP